MLRGSKSGRSLLGKVLDLDSHQSQSHPRQQARTRRSCRPSPTVPKGGRREAPRPPPEPGPATATCPPTSAQRPQPTTTPSQTACSSVTAGGGRAWFLEHSADQCGALSAAPKEQDKAPHMVEDVLKTKPGPRRTSHTTRRAAWRSGRRWLPRPYGFGRRSTRK